MLTAVLIPRSDDPGQVGTYDLAYRGQLPGGESMVRTQFERFQPELADHPLSPDMHVLWLTSVEAEEEYPIRSRDVLDAWHPGVSS